MRPFLVYQFEDALVDVYIIKIHAKERTITDIDFGNEVTSYSLRMFESLPDIVNGAERNTGEICMQ